MNTNGLSPLMQAAVGGEQQEENVLGGQEIAKMSGDERGGYSLDEENGQLMTTDQFGGEEGILINDPNDILEGRTLGDDDYEYTYSIEEDGSYTLTGKRENPVEPEQEQAPQDSEQMPGGVGGTPMQMTSPYKNYRNPQDYEVFNWGNKPTPFEKRKKY
jgi:hypothetical protein